MCAKIGSFFQNDSGYTSIGGNLDNSCNDHAKLFRDLLSGEEDICETPYYSLGRSRVTIAPGTPPHPIPSIAYLSGRLEGGYWKYLAPWPDTSISTYIGQAQQVDRNWIDLQWLKECKSDCDDFHTDCNGLFGTVLTARPQWLIDVSSLRIVPCHDGAKYLALSYVWGGVQPLLTTSSNISALREPGALGTSPFHNLIPKTVLHAMSLTRLLDQRYLWCDALCIMQDDDQNKHTEFANMPSIYANSELTIIAANGQDSNYGLRGMKGISEPRSYEPKTYSLGEKLKLRQVHLPDGGTSQKSSIKAWESRAWTFQEYLFSRRQLIFYDDLVGWQCSHSARFEEFFWPNKDLRIRPKILFSSDLKHYGVNLASRVPNMITIAWLVEKFNRRQVSYVEDALYAFTGIATVLSQSCDGGFISGLPVLFFNLALLWQSHTVERRVPGKDSCNPCLPSWSWVGWQGDIKFASWRQLSKPSTLTGYYQPQQASLKTDKVSSKIRWKSHQARSQPGTIVEYKWSMYEEKFRDNKMSPSWIR